MIKKILVALDPDMDTPVATRYAADIAQRHDAEVTGLAVVDMGSIEASSRGGGIGSMYLMGRKCWESRDFGFGVLRCGFGFDHTQTQKPQLKTLSTLVNNAWITPAKGLHNLSRT